MASTIPRAAVIGHPVAHSRSPLMHNAGFAALGLDWRYDAIDVPPDELGAFIDGLRGSELAGVNVTIPHKVTAAALCDELSAEAREAGSVNTVLVSGDRLRGETTDGRGLLWALGEAEPADALVLGAGGAARAVVRALAHAGWSVRAAARRPDAVPALGARVEPWPPTLGAALIVNATPIGLSGDGEELPVDPALLAGAAIVCDLAYRGDGSETALCAAAHRAGARVVDGLEVLLGQGVLAFRLFTGLDAPVEAMRAAVRPA